MNLRTRVVYKPIVNNMSTTAQRLHDCMMLAVWPSVQALLCIATPWYMDVKNCGMSIANERAVLYAHNGRRCHHHTDTWNVMSRLSDYLDVAECSLLSCVVLDL